MEIVTIRELSLKLSRLDKLQGKTFLLVNASKRKLIAEISVKEPPETFEVITKNLFTR